MFKNTLAAVGPESRCYNPPVIPIREEGPLIWELVPGQLCFYAACRAWVTMATLLY